MTTPRFGRVVLAVAIVGLLFAHPAGAQAVATRPSMRDEFLNRFARSYFPGRTGQIVVVPREGHIITRKDPAVYYMHGSPWPYDARIPFLLHGPAFVRAGTYAEPVAQQDMAPTLATLLGVPMPASCAGRSLRSALKTTAERPRLIALFVLDGMRVDYFDRHAASLPTLQRLRREGAWFSNARVNFLPTITSVAHATIATGADPRVHGIVGNTLFDRVADKAADVYPGLSPRNLMALTLADVWNVQTDGRAVIVGQGSTPRAALPLAGHGACLANGRPVIAISYSTETGGWETNSECYRRPDYLKDRNARSWWEASGGRWLGHSIASAGEIRSSAPFSGFETDALKATIEREPLGADETTDLLLVNLKTPDYVGHEYGPDSPELAAALTALDRDLALVIAALEAKVGPRTVLAFTADHGMPPEPDPRRSQQRVYTEDIVKLIHDTLDPERGRLVRLYPPEDMQLTVDRGRLRELGLELDAVRRILEAQPFIFAAFTEDEVRAASARLGGCDGGPR